MMEISGFMRTRTSTAHMRIILVCKYKIP
jgi:hypothetical protein